MVSNMLLMGVYFLAVLGALFWTRWRRKTRWPFKETDKLLRGPGETLRRQIIELDESFGAEVFGGIVATMISFGVVLFITTKFPVLRPALAMSVAWGVAGLSVLCSAWRVTKLMKRRVKLFVGWFGERFAADQMRPLTLQGYRVFHDVPLLGSKGPYNIDHVVIGPTGVTVVEVKTYRKRLARNGSTEHEVTFDGDFLNFPWGKRREELDQVAWAAASLSEWIFERTGLKINPKQVLTFPSWLVRSPIPSSPLRVVHTKFLADAIVGRRERTLTDPQIDLIARQLEIQCRDVVD